MDSILMSIKKLVGISDEDTSFDTDMIIHINTALNYLSQIGANIQPVEITGSSEKWDDVVSDISNLQSIKTYVYVQVKKIFDAPTNPGVLKALEEAGKEAEWRIKVQTEM